jgi:uncharacterized membrane protein
MTKSFKIVQLFQKVGDFILGPSNRGNHRKKVFRSKKLTILKQRRGFFERCRASWPEFVMLKAQLAILALFFTVMTYLVFLPAENLIFVSLMLVITSYLIYLTTTQLRKAFEQDYRAYRNFVAMCVAIAWVFTLLVKFTATFSTEGEMIAILPPFLALGIVVASFATFKLKYGRNFTYGTVEESRGEAALVRVGYDIRSNVKAGLYPVKSLIRVRKGDTVKLSVERSLLGLKGARVREIIERVNR